MKTVIERTVFEHFAVKLRARFEETTPDVSDRRYYNITLVLEFVEFPERNQEITLIDDALDDICALWQELRPQLLTPIQETPAENEE
jgi:hypothetical protein